MLNDLKRFIQQANLLTRVILVNIGVFLLINLLMIISKWTGLENAFDVTSAGVPVFKITHWLSGTSELSYLIFKPWSIFTYMFLHEDFFHILFNMLVLFYMGQIFCSLLGEKKLLPLYILSGLSGFLLYFVSFNIFPVFPDGDIPILGASAAVMGIMVATATYFPNYQIRLMFLGNIPLKLIAAIYVIADFVALNRMNNTGGHIAHLGGAIFGFYAAYQLKKGKDVLGWWMSLYSYTLKKLSFKKKSKIKVVHQQKSASPKAKKTRDNQEIIDGILDKISKSGYDSLTKKEKEILFNASNS